MKVTGEPDAHANGKEFEVCPWWCEGQHLGWAEDDQGFHHDGPVTIISIEHPVTEKRGYDLLVNVSLHTQAGASPERPYIEIQDESQTLALLTPEECLSLCRALLDAAASIEGEEPARAHVGGHLVHEVESAPSVDRMPLVDATGTA